MICNDGGDGRREGFVRLSAVSVGSSYRRVMGVLCFSKMPSFLASSKPVMMPYFPISGRNFSTGASRVTRPASTAWRQATAVRSLVMDAIQHMVSSWKGLADSSFKDVTPAALE